MTTYVNLWHASHFPRFPNAPADDSVKSHAVYDQTDSSRSVWPEKEYCWIQIVILWSRLRYNNPSRSFCIKVLQGIFVQKRDLYIY